MGAELNSWIVAIVKPPLEVLAFLLRKAYALLFAWWLDNRLVKREREKFVADIHRCLGFLFQEYGAHIIPNEHEAPPSFDFVIATLVAGDLFLRFFRGRGDISVMVSSLRTPSEWHELSTLLSAMGTGVPRQGFSHLLDVERVLRPHMNHLSASIFGKPVSCPPPITGRVRKTR